jgi:Do/DeqQ family serine protease
VIFGFSLAFLSFSCSTPGTKKTARAEESPVVIPQEALAVAESLQTAMRSISEKVQPSVVELKTVSVRRQQAPRFNGIPWEFFFGTPDNNGEEREFRSEGLGSGIIVRRDGDTYYVLTNQHVVEDATEISVALSDGKELSASLVGGDARRDLAMVSFKSGDTYPLAVLGDSDEVKVGDWAIALGNPLGFMSSMTMGIVSAVGRTGGPANNINDFIQTDASINRGNSGGALVNIRGEVIGINTWIASGSSSGGSVGLGFAIPINNAKRSIDEFISSGTTRYGWLGVSLVDPPRETLAALGLESGRGALVSQIFIGSPAEKGGVQPGDFITHLNGREMRGMNALTMAVGDLKPGERAAFTLIRGGKSQELQVRIEERTEEVAAENNKLWPGVYTAPLSESVRTALKLDAGDRGVYVADVIARSPSAIVGLQRGDRITGVNGEAVNDLEDFYRVLREKTRTELWFEVIREGSTVETMRFKR